MPPFSIFGYALSISVYGLLMDYQLFLVSFLIFWAYIWGLYAGLKT